MTTTRKMSWAGRFYPAREETCRRQLAVCTDYDASDVLEHASPLAGIVPHAGWDFSGPTAGKVFSYMKQYGAPQTFMLFGAVHRMAARSPVLYGAGAWDTPLGPLPVNNEIAAELAERCEESILNDPQLHDGEHSIEVQLPFIKFLFPDADIVPVLCPPEPGALALGRAAGELIKDHPAGRVVAVASADLTHYGHDYGFAPKGTGPEALEWVKQVNDKRFIDNATAFQAQQILDDAPRYHNTCGAGAAAAAVSAAEQAGSSGGVLLQYTTSHDVMPRGAPSLFVGYAGIVF